MEIMFPLITVITALVVCPVMLFLLQDGSRKKPPFIMLKVGLIGFLLAAGLNLLAEQKASGFAMLFFGCCGALYAEILVLFSRVVQKTNQHVVSPFYDDGSPSRFYITGDKHRNFDSVERFCCENGTRKKDVMIILGDAGFNYYGDKRDDDLKERASNMNITFFCLHGNKENRPSNVGTYGKRSFCGGKVYYEPKYPNIFFAIDGETYNFEGREYIVLGGAHSVDKNLCLQKGLPYWEDEMPTPILMKYIERRLAEREYKIYGVLTHTCPFRYLPTEMFMTTRQSARVKRTPKLLKFFQKKPFQPDIDRTTEYWLGELEQKLDYKEWFCGHYHVDKPIDKITMMFQEIRPLHRKKR